MLHWLVNGEPALAFIVEREQFLVPISIILRVSLKNLYKTFGYSLFPYFAYDIYPLSCILIYF